MITKNKAKQAIECLNYGSHKNLVLTEVEKPTPKDNEVPIKIKATSVTTSDVLIRELKATPVARFMVQIIFGFGKQGTPL